MAEVQTPAGASAKDTALMMTSIVLLIAGIVAFYWFDEQPLVIRVGMVIAGLAASLMLASVQAGAHAKLVSVVPAADSTVASPKMIVVHFDERQLFAQAEGHSPFAQMKRERVGNFHVFQHVFIGKVLDAEDDIARQPRERARQLGPSAPRHRLEIIERRCGQGVKYGHGLQIGRSGRD